MRSPPLNINKLIDREFDSLPSGPPIQEASDESLNIPPQQYLFIAVIRRAIADATAPDPETSDDSERKKQEAHKRQARAVIFSNATVTSDHFKDVCDLAGVEVSVIRRRVADMIRNNQHLKDDDVLT